MKRSVRGAWRRVERWLPGGRERLREEIRAELREHVARLTEENVARGLSPEEAARAARLRFGNPQAIADRCQDQRAPFRVEELVADLRFGLRLLARRPGFALVAVVTLTLGIGANSAIFSLVQGVLLQRLPFRDPDRLMTSRGFSVPDYEDLRQSTGSFDGTAIWASNLYTVVANGQAEQIPGIVATPELFSLLGDPIRGRAFRPEENDEPLAILSWEMWQSRFGGSDDVLGRTMILGKTAHTIVGVMPRGFHFPSERYEFWVTLGSALNTVPEQKRDRSLRIFGVVAHLRPGALPSEARRELRAFSERQSRAHPDTNGDVRFEIVPILRYMVGAVRPALLILLGAVGFVLLITCANVASLLLARTATRRRELALRAALGAARSRIVRQLLAESVLLAAIGGALGLALAAAGVRWLRSWPSAGIPRLDTVGVNVEVLLYTLVVSALTGLVFGVLPALAAARPDPAASLRAGGRTTSGASGRRLRPLLVAVEVGLAMMVTVGAALLVKSFLALTGVDPGFSSDRVITGSSVLVDVSPERRPALVASVLERIASLPGVEVAGAGTGLPPETAQRQTRYEVPGAASAKPRHAYFLAVTPGYLRALRTRLLAGRLFGPQDSAEAPRVVMVSERLARAAFGDRNPIGERLRVLNTDQSPRWRTVVGVVDDVRYGGLDDADAPAIYTPYPQNPHLLAGIYLIVRTHDESPATVDGIRRVVRSAAPGLYAVNVRPMSRVVSATVSSPRLNASLLSLFSALALVLSATGIYGLLSYSVSQRVPEIGVRIALGARGVDVVLLVVRHAALVVGTGILGGLAGSLASTRVLRSLLFGVQPTDPGALALVALALVGVGLLSSYVPVLRATRIDPVVALRQE